MNLNSNYWQDRYESANTGWDAGSITTPLKAYFDQLEDKKLKILIPGCGNAHEFDYLLEKGFHSTFVLDYAKAPLENIQKRVPNEFSNQLINEDFFNHSNQYDVIVEQTFFCALEPTLRSQYVQKMHSLLKPNGILVGLLFQFPLTEEGPPFGGSKEEYHMLFSELFQIKTIETAYNSIKPREGNELFFIFVKK